jgi:hypothetical protein
VVVVAVSGGGGGGGGGECAAGNDGDSVDVVVVVTSQHKNGDIKMVQTNCKDKQRTERPMDAIAARALSSPEPSGLSRNA